MTDDPPRDYRKWPPGCTCWPDEPGSESLVPCPHHPLPERPADLPYGGTSGWSGSESSRDRALDADASGKTSEAQAAALSLLARNGRYGATDVDFQRETGWGHGRTSGALSVLHMVGRACRLKDRRDKCEIYVLPEHVNGRETKAHASTKRTPLSDGERSVMAAVGLAYGQARNTDQPMVSVPVSSLEAMHRLIANVYDTP